jgi:phosphatidylglycerol:prolipoprotein diacylglycerol transferase
VIWDAIQFPNINPAALTLPGFDLFGGHWGPFPLRWYALAYIAGLLLGWRWMVWLIRRDRLWAPGKAPLSVPQADDFLFWATLGVILGGRLGYVLFYMLPDPVSRARIAADFFTIFRIWDGGMAFHGGLVGVTLAAWWFTRRLHIDHAHLQTLAEKRVVAEPPADRRSAFVRVGKLGWIKKTELAEIEEKSRTQKIDLLRLGDLAAAATPIGLFFGRIANFINGELWGRHTDAPWGMIFCNDRIGCAAGHDPRHPSQLYEATLEGLVLFSIINIATLRFESLRRPGFNVGLFLVCYGIIRLSLEFVREPDAQMPEALKRYVTMGMLLSIPMIIAGAWLIRRAFTAPKLAA